MEIIAFQTKKINYFWIFITRKIELMVQIDLICVFYLRVPELMQYVFRLPFNLSPTEILLYF